MKSHEQVHAQHDRITALARRLAMRSGSVFEHFHLWQDLNVSQDNIRCVTSMSVPDREQSTRCIPLTRAQYIDPREAEQLPDKEILKWLTGQVQWMIAHEFKESWLLDGVPMLDPEEDHGPRLPRVPLTLPVSPPQYHAQRDFTGS